jgi:DNA-binding response OmpR family regulator
MFMPGKDGIETIQDLKRDFPGVKILAVSGGTGSGKVYLLEVARYLGASSILKKPFGRNALLDRVRELLGENMH